MNTLAVDFRSFLECDNSPFVLFDADGKVLYLNNAAEILMGYTDAKTLYTLALTHAPQTFGYKTTHIPLQYETLYFYALTVGYRDEEHICIRLYHQPRMRHHVAAMHRHMTKTDINLVLEAAIALFQIHNTNKLSLLVDQDIPPFRIDQNTLSKLLRKSLHAFRASDSIDISLKLLVGEYIIIDGSKEGIVQLHMQANGRYSDEDEVIEEISQHAHISASFQEHSITLHIPFIR